MDYLLNSLICTILCAQLARNFTPGVPYIVWALLFAGLFTGLNLFGIRTSARINDGLAIGMGIVIAIFFVIAAHYVFGTVMLSPDSSGGPFTIRTHSS